MTLYTFPQFLNSIADCFLDLILKMKIQFLARGRGAFFQKENMPLVFTHKKMGRDMGAELIE